MTPRIPLAVPVSERDHGQGPASAMVTLVQYGDYECPIRAKRRVLCERFSSNSETSCALSFATSRSSASIPTREDDRTHVVSLTKQGAALATTHSSLKCAIRTLPAFLSACARQLGSHGNRANR